MTQSKSSKQPLAANLEFIEELWKQYEKSPSNVSAQWRNYFKDLEKDEPTSSRRGPTAIIGHRQLRSREQPAGDACATCGRSTAMSELQNRVEKMIRNFRVRGHRIAQTNPLNTPLPEIPELEPEFYNFAPEDMGIEFHADDLSDGQPLALGEIITRLRSTYTGNVGIQFMHIDGLEERQWIQTRMETTRTKVELSRDEQLRILTKLTDAVTFERYLQTKFVGAKSFSLEGAESLIPLLEMAIEKAGRNGVTDIVLGMPHRGRLNVLSNIMGKDPRKIFNEFQDTGGQHKTGRGDVKYHLGYHRDWICQNNHKVHLDLTFNPSHLEYVNPVVMGRLRARMDRSCNTPGKCGLSILIHGDAAFAGEGIVQESLNLSELVGYSVGGTLHIVVNNQIGFTTPPKQGRSSIYATDVAKMLQIPILHVNGENPEAVAFAVELALDYRSKFGHDCVIDMKCYRRRGHNEGDEPTFTQPEMYRAIKQQKTVRQGYLEHLLALRQITRDEASEISKKSRKYLDEEFEASKDSSEVTPDGEVGKAWRHYRGGPEKEIEEVSTGVDRAALEALLEKLTALPEGFRAHPKIKKGLEARLEMARGQRPLDWGAAEALAAASLSVQGYPARMSGQDSERGTFSHRHAVLHDIESGATYVPLNHLADEQAPVRIINSPLSEGGVLGFEYGYSLSYPDALVAWEAQFGDFANAAQVYMDQFLASGENKWQRLSGLVLLLPHGLEGTGPEHASARLERFLSLAALDNMQVINPTTPGQFFHALRRQVLRPWRKPLVVMAPKSMLRHPRAVSTLDELAGGGFQRVIPDSHVPSSSADRVILCSGKLYWELLEAREKNEIKDAAIARIEQLYPLDWTRIEEAIEGLADGKRVLWVQEEPRNMGAANNIQLRFGRAIEKRWSFEVISRPESSSPATGSAASHKLEQQRIIAKAFDLTDTLD